jgi:leader peptidase (prepilin peptidase) / N-methyltransferase
MNITLLITALLGWVAGGLLNYLADTLPAQRQRERDQANPANRLPAPLFRYFPWPKTSPELSQWSSLRPWLVQILMSLTAALLWLHTPYILGFALNLLILLNLGLVMVIDLEHRLILFSTVIPVALLGLASGWARLGLLNTMLGGLAAISISMIIFIFGRLFTDLLGRLRHRKIEEVAFGFGDVLFSGVIGLLIGWPQILHCLLVTILAGGLFSLIYLLILLGQRRYNFGRALPVAPLLIFGAIWASYF